MAAVEGLVLMNAARARLVMMARACALMLACGGLARAQSVPTLRLQLDQDVLYKPKNEDRNYTQGLLFEWSADRARFGHLLLPLDGLDRLLHIPRGGDAEVCVLVFGTTIFTPEDIADTEPIFDDRPYAALAYAAGRKISSDSTNAIMTELSVGVLGLGFAEVVQREIHQYLRSLNPVGAREDPEGWSHQISDGGEPTLLYRVAGERVLLRGRYAEQAQRDWLQMIGGIEAGAGYYTYGRVSGGIRAGWIDPDFSSSGLQAGNVVTMGAGRRHPRETRSTPLCRDAYLFARASGYATLYNAMLQGQFRDSDVTVSDDDVERWVEQTEVGGLVRLGGFGVSYSVSRRSSEFESPSSRHHYWGTISLTYAYAF